MGNLRVVGESIFQSLSSRHLSSSTDPYLQAQSRVAIPLNECSGCTRNPCTEGVDTINTLCQVTELSIITISRQMVDSSLYLISAKHLLAHALVCDDGTPQACTKHHGTDCKRHPLTRCVTRRVAKHSGSSISLGFASANFTAKTRRTRYAHSIVYYEWSFTIHPDRAMKCAKIHGLFHSLEKRTACCAFARDP